MPFCQADDVWEAEDYATSGLSNQEAVRWYASRLTEANVALSPENIIPSRTDAAPHRQSSDVSIDHAVGKAVVQHKQREFRKYQTEEHSLLLWNTKNLEYALGANVSDLSMKFWDSDERHAFDGDHVMMRQGYASVVRYIEKKLKEKGSKFKCITNFPIGKVEYARKSMTMPYADASGLSSRKLIEMSDACCVTTRDGSLSHKFDMLVSTLPLGILKEAVDSKGTKSKSRVIFDPPLPFPKVDAIQSTGFGLLNKVYLQFRTPFWRLPSVLDDGQTLFGNASAFNAHHYMFFDVGKTLGRLGDQPAVLMTLISGKEAVRSEQLGEEGLVADVVATLRRLFSPESVPDPESAKVTRWGSDEFSRGCYTFLPPGATDQDFQILQSPINGNGDSLTLEGSETMRLFWAGEHTTALHPSMAHGAMMSGIRAAKEVISTINFNYNDDKSGFDKLIPLSIFRKSNPTVKLQCSLCHLVGSRVREGSLLAFQRGARQVLVHNNCGETSPEVEVRDGRWKSVIKAVNRGKQIHCCMCGRVGATIGCTHDNCFRSFHFSCAEDTGWRFERDGKVYFCDLHRQYDDSEPPECDRISLVYYKSKLSPGQSAGAMKCTLCYASGDNGPCGKMLAFQSGRRRLLVHDFCVRYSTIMEVCEDPESLLDVDFKNVFELAGQTRICHLCKMNGATIGCEENGCPQHFHFLCAQRSVWDFAKSTGRFRCQAHRARRKTRTTTSADSKPQHALFQGGVVHNLFCRGSETVTKGNTSNGMRRRDITKLRAVETGDESGGSDEGGSSATKDHDDDSLESDDEATNGVMEISLCASLPQTKEGDLISLCLGRGEIGESWGFAVDMVKGAVDGKSALLLRLDSPKAFKELEGITSPLLLKAVGSQSIGSSSLPRLQDLMSLLRQAYAVTLNVRPTVC